MRFRYLPDTNAEWNLQPPDVLAAAAEDCLAHLHLSYPRQYGRLRLGTNASLHGYPLSLTPTEARLLQYLCLAGDAAVPADDLLDACFVSAYRMTRAAVATHLSSVNQKARSLGNRPLVLSDRAVSGYRLNPDM